MEEILNSLSGIRALVDEDYELAVDEISKLSVSLMTPGMKYNFAIALYGAGDKESSVRLAKEAFGEGVVAAAYLLALLGYPPDLESPDFGIRGKAFCLLKRCSLEQASSLSEAVSALAKLGESEGIFPRVAYVLGHGNVTGGAKVIMEHLNHLARDKWEAKLVCFRAVPSWFPLEAKVLQCDLRRLGRITDSGFDVVVASYWDHVPALVGLDRAVSIHFVQGDEHLFGDTGVLPDDIREFADVVYALPVKHWSVSESVAEVLLRKYGRRSEVIGNGVSDYFFQAAPKKQRDFGHIPSILVVGADSLRFKRIPEVLRCLSNLRKKGLVFQATWVTPVPPRPGVVPGELADLKVVVRPLQDELARVYAEADIFVSGSDYEAFSLPPLEAMAAGAAVVSTANKGVIQYARQEYNALLAPVGDWYGLEHALERLLSDTGLRERLSASGMETAAMYRWEQVMAKVKRRLLLAALQPYVLVPSVQTLAALCA